MKRKPVVAIGVYRGERGGDGGRIARPEPSRGRVLPPLGVPEAEDQGRPRRGPRAASSLIV
jgi:hypothetical protein